MSWKTLLALLLILVVYEGVEYWKIYPPCTQAGGAVVWDSNWWMLRCKQPDG